MIKIGEKEIASRVIANPVEEAVGTLNKLDINGTIYSIEGGSGESTDVRISGTSITSGGIANIESVPYLTTAPTEDYTGPGIKKVFLSTEPAEYYNGYEYLIEGQAGEPDAYIKNASVSGNTLTLTKKDDSTVTYTPTASSVAWGDVTGKPFSTLGSGFRVDEGALTFDPMIIASVTYVENRLDSKQDISTLDTDVQALGFIKSGALAGYATETYVNNHHDSTKQDKINTSQVLVFTLADDTTRTIELYSKE